MSELITLDIRLRAFVRGEKRNRWIASCPKIDVVTQGVSLDDAKKQLDDAVHAWFEDCVERGTLETALRECGWRTATREEAEAADERITLQRKEDDDILGCEFDVHVTVPAYHAAAAIMANA